MLPQTQATNAAYNPNKDFEVQQPPGDGISSLKFSPKSNLLVAGSWDNQVRCWDVQQNGTAVPTASVSHQAPVLATAWSGDGTRVFTGSCDRTAKMWTLATNQHDQVGAHDQPVKTLHWVDELNMLVTGSWDRTLRYWDLRQQQPAFQMQLPERVYAMDVKFPLAVVATAGRQIIMYNLTQYQQEFRRIESPLKCQSRVVSCFPDKTGFALGSIEGRVAIHHVDDKKDAEKNFAFKCHRDHNEIYAVNSIAFHPGYHTFATTGADGSFHFWDKNSKQRLKNFPRCPLPIPACDFNGDGSIFAYAVSYDWSRGSDYYNPTTAKNLIFLHAVQEIEIKPRPKQAKR